MSRILLVDDDPTNVEIVTRFLRHEKHEVITAADGPSGVALADQEKPDLILMDMLLPNPGDGQQATREIRRRLGLEKVPIIALTASGMPQQVAEMFKAGCNDVVTKPIEFKQLLARISALLTAETKP